MRPDVLAPAARHNVLGGLVFAVPLLLAVPLILAVLLVLAGCAPDHGAAPPPEPAFAPAPAPAREQLAALAAAAQDRRFTARYTLATEDQPARTVEVTRAIDGTWRVDIPRGALGGTADVAVARTAAGRYQCALGPGQPAGSAVPTMGPTDSAPTDPLAEPSGDGDPTPDAWPPAPPGPACVRVADPDVRVPFAFDPRVQLPFTDWLSVLTDRRAPLSVTEATPSPGATGACFSIESTSVSLAAPLEAGIYCFSADGILTGARLGLGDLSLDGAPGAGPPTVRLPGPVVAGEPLPMAAPPSPTPTATVDQ